MRGLLMVLDDKKIEKLFDILNKKEEVIEVNYKDYVLEKLAEKIRHENLFSTTRHID